MPSGHDRGLTMATEPVKCACEDCVCEVAAEKAVMKDGRAFC